MEQHDNKDFSSFGEVDLLTVCAPRDLLPQILTSLGLEKSAIGLSGEFHRADLLAALNSEKWAERVAALQTLGERTEEVPARLLIIALQDEQENVRAVAARVSGKMKDQELVQPLLLALLDASWMVRAAVAQALGKIGSESTIEPLVKVLHEDRDESVRASAAEALGSMGPAAPLQPLLLALQDKAWLVRDAAIEALGISGQNVPLEPLTAALQDIDESVRHAAAAALQQMHPKTVHATDELALPGQNVSIENSDLETGTLAENFPPAQRDNYRLWHDILSEDSSHLPSDKS
jgi:hypothetical protein